MNILVETLAYSGMALVVGSGVPQIIKLIKTKQSQDISISLYIMLILGMFFILPQAFVVGELVFILNYFLNLVFFFTILVLTLKYRV